MQVFLVQLAERSGAAGGGASASSQQRPPSARCLRHLVAISKGGDGDSEAVYSFSEVRRRGGAPTGGRLVLASFLCACRRGVVQELACSCLPFCCALVSNRRLVLRKVGRHVLALFYMCSKANVDRG